MTESQNNSNESQTFRSSNDEIQDKTEITTFISDTNDMRSNLDGVTTATAASHLPRSETQDLINLLQRPFKIATGIWSTTDDATPFTPADMSVSGALLKVDFPDVLFASSALIREKVNRFSYLRAGMKFKLMINAPPYYGGKLMIIFRPFSEEQGSRELARNHMAGLSSYQKMIVDASATHEATMVVPFAANTTAWNLLVDGLQSLGTLEVHVLNVLRSAITPVTASYSLYASFEDVEITVPTPLSAVIPAATDLVVTSKSGCKIMTTKQKLARKDKYLLKVAALNEMREADRVKLESHLLSAYSEDVPDAQIADDFQNLPAKDYTYNNSDNSTSMSLSREEKTCIPDMSRTSSAMDMSEILSRESLLQRFAWSVNDTFDTVLQTFFVSPQAVNHQNGVYFPTMLAYLSLFFRFWTGPIHYKLTVAKTAFHSGRLRISYLPEARTGGVDATTLDNAYNFIWDLSESNEFSFEVPYVGVTPVKRLANLFGLSGSNVGEAIVPGRLAVSVLVPLIASETVSDSVDVNLWISAPKMRFYVQSSSFFVPHVVSPLAEERTVPKKVLIDITQFPDAQVLGEPVSSTNQESQSVQSIMPTSTVNAETSTSEAITNFDQFTKRSSVMYTSSIQDLTVYPNYFYLPGDVTPCSILDRLSYLYVFNSGSQKFKVVRYGDLAPTTDLMVVTNHPVPDLALPPLTGTTASIEDISMINIPHLNPIVEVRLPYFSNQVSRVCNHATDYLTSVLQYNNLTSPSPTLVFRSAGDDFAFGTLVGPPAVTTSVPV